MLSVIDHCLQDWQTDRQTGFCCRNCSSLYFWFGGRPNQLVVVVTTFLVN